MDSRRSPRKTTCRSEPMNYEEQREQMFFINYLQWRQFKSYNHSPNEGKRTPQEGNKLKRMGMSKGFPDLEICVAKNGFHGLYLEFKSSKGKLSKEQQEWVQRLTEAGYKVAVVRSCSEAIDVFQDYMKGS